MENKEIGCWNPQIYGYEGCELVGLLARKRELTPGADFPKTERGKGKGPLKDKALDPCTHLLESGLQAMMASRILKKANTTSGSGNSAKIPLVSWPWSQQSH